MSEKQPLYLQIAEMIKGEYIKAEDAGEARLPGEVALSRQYGVSRTTIRESLRLLEQQGWVHSRHGIGTFVSHREEGHVIYTFDVLTGLGTILNAGKGGTTTVSTMLSEMRGSRALKKEFNWPDGPLIKLERVRSQEFTPVALTIDVAPAGFLGDLRDDEAIRSLFEVLSRNGHAPHHAVARLRAITPTGKIARLLTKGKPVIHSHEVVYDKAGQVVAVSDDYLDTSIIDLLVRRRAI